MEVVKKNIQLLNTWLTRYQQQQTEAAQLNAVRIQFILSASDKITLNKTFLKVTQLPALPVIEGYKAALQVIRAKYEIWPINQYNTAKTGLIELDKLINIHKTDFELRYIRASVLNNLPIIFNRQADLKLDVSFLVQKVPNLNKENTLLIFLVTDFLIQTQHITAAERLALIPIRDSAYQLTLKP